MLLPEILDKPLVLSCAVIWISETDRQHLHLKVKPIIAYPQYFGVQLEETWFNNRIQFKLLRFTLMIMQYTYTAVYKVHLI